jgi:hypothetical protein
MIQIRLYTTRSCACRHVSCRTLIRSPICLAGLRSIQRAFAGISRQSAFPSRDPAFSWLQTGADEGLLEIVDDIVDVL